MTPSEQRDQSGRSEGMKDMMRMFSDETPGIKVYEIINFRPPIIVLIGSLIFVGFVILLHIIGKYLGSK
jgi:hypothetical protein